MSLEGVPVPLLVSEEHHESYLAWSVAIARGWLPAEGNVLLHVDEHADWALPRSRLPLPVAPPSPATARRLVEGELHVASFLWPAIYQGTFRRICWLRREHRASASLARREMFVTTDRDNRARLVTGLARGLGSAAGDPGIRQVVWELCLPEEPPDLTGASVAWSFDLDYFVSNASPHHPSHRIEVTRQEHDRFLTDPHHFLRICPGGRVSAHHEEARYWLVFEPTPGAEAPPLGEADLTAALETLRGTLLATGARPSLITVARSVKSGYTPPSLAPLVERRLLDLLTELFPVRQVPWSEVLDEAEALAGEVRG